MHSEAFCDARDNDLNTPETSVEHESEDEKLYSESSMDDLVMMDLGNPK